MPTLTPNQLNLIIVDDHQLFRQGLISLIHKIDSAFTVISEAKNGQELLELLDAGLQPDIVIMDMNMPVLNGYQSTIELKKRYPSIGILALTMLDDEASLVKMLRAGINGYLTKDIEPKELHRALWSIKVSGYYYNEFVAGTLVRKIQDTNSTTGSVELSEQELRFIELSCSDDTYQMIADKMCLSVKTIDGYRAKLFDKLDVKSRVGLVLYALSHKLVSLEMLNINS